MTFRERRIADAVQKALRAAGADDRALACELAGVVSLFLSRTEGTDPPTTRDVREMLTRVLRETGHEAAASRYEETLRERDRLSRELLVRYPRGEVEEGPLLESGGDEVAPWSRTRMIGSLMRGRGLPESVAETLVAALEDRLAALGLRTVGVELLRELLEHEVEEQGLEGAPEAERPYRVPHELVVRALGEEGAGRPDRVLAGEILRQHALAEILQPAAAAAHREGRLHVHGLENPLAVERLDLPAGVLAPAPHAADLLLALRRTLEVLADHVRTCIGLPDLVSALARRVGPGEPPGPWADRLLGALDRRDAYGQRRGPLVDLTVPFGRGPDGFDPTPFARALVAALRAGTGGPEIDVTFHLPDATQNLEPALAATLLGLAEERPGTALRLPRKSDLPVHPDPAAVPPALRLSLGRVAINLPIAFATAEVGALPDALRCLDVAGSLALGALHDRFWMQREGRSQGLHGIVVGLGGPAHVQVSADDQEVDVEVWGLQAALALLAERGVIPTSRATEVAARILAYLDYLLGAERQGVRFRVRLGGVLDTGVRRRLLQSTGAWADRYELEDLRQALRLPADHGTLPVSIPLLSGRNAPLLEAAFAERLGPGLAVSAAAFDDTQPPHLLLRRLQAETRLGLLVPSRFRAGEGLLEIQEELFA